MQPFSSLNLTNNEQEYHQFTRFITPTTTYNAQCNGLKKGMRILTNIGHQAIGKWYRLTHAIKAILSGQDWEWMNNTKIIEKLSHSISQLEKAFDQTHADSKKSQTEKTLFDGNHIQKKITAIKEICKLLSEKGGVSTKEKDLIAIQYTANLVSAHAKRVSLATSEQAKKWLPTAIEPQKEQTLSFVSAETPSTLPRIKQEEPSTSLKQAPPDDITEEAQDNTPDATKPETSEWINAEEERLTKNAISGNLDFPTPKAAATNIETTEEINPVEKEPTEPSLLAPPLAAVQKEENPKEEPAKINSTRRVSVLQSSGLMSLLKITTVAFFAFSLLISSSPFEYKRPTTGCTPISDNELETYLQMTPLERSADPTLKPSCTSLHSPEAQILLFQYTLPHEATLNDFHEFKRESCTTFKKHYKKNLLKLHPDKHKDKKAAQEASTKLGNAYDSLCPKPKMETRKDWKA